MEELLAHGATVVVLSLGMNRRLHVDPRTLDYLAQDVPVAGLFHSTC